MSTRLCLKREREGGIASDIDLLDRVHLNRDGKRHV
jgi:hypothetical protein